MRTGRRGRPGPMGLKGALIEFRPLTWSLSKPAARGLGSNPERLPLNFEGPSFRVLAVREPGSFQGQAESCF